MTVSTHRPRSLRWTCAGLLLTTTFAWTTSSLAQAPPTEQSAAEMTMARQLGNQGLERARAGDCASAIEPLTRSEALHHAPTTLTVLGECHVSVGKLVQGAEELTRVVRESLDPRAPAAYRAAQDRARARLEETRLRISRLKIVIEGEKVEGGLTVRLDGQPIAVASLGIERPVDPGPHTVEVQATGYRPASGEATLREGEAQTLTLQLVPLPTAPAPIGPAPPLPPAVVPPPPARTPDPDPATRVTRSNVPTYLSFGIAVAGVATGSVFGVVTLSKTSSLDRVCQTRSTCPSSSQPDIDSAKTTALVSTVAFAAGGAGLLAGLYFALRQPGSEPVTKADGHEPTPTVHPWVSLDAIGLDGSF